MFSVVTNRIIIPFHMRNQCIFKNGSIIDWPKGAFLITCKGKYLPTSSE